MKMCFYMVFDSKRKEALYRKCKFASQQNFTVQYNSDQSNPQFDRSNQDQFLAVLQSKFAKCHLCSDANALPTSGILTL